MKALHTLGFFLAAIAIAIAAPMTARTISKTTNTIDKKANNTADAKAVPRDDPKYGTRCGVPGMSCRLLERSERR